MKRLVKAIFKPLWRATHPLRRPFLVRLEAYLRRCVAPAEHLMNDETNTLMEHLVRELVRLQEQVDYLQQTIEELSPGLNRVAVAGEIAPGEQLKAG